MLDDPIFVGKIKKENFLATTIFNLTPSSGFWKIADGLELNPTGKFYQIDDLINSNRTEIENIINSNRDKLENIIAEFLPNGYLRTHMRLMELATVSYNRSQDVNIISDYHSFVIDFIQKIEEKHINFLEKTFFDNHCSTWKEVEEKFGYNLAKDYRPSTNNQYDNIYAAILADYFFSDAVNNMQIYLKSFKEFKQNYQSVISTEFNKNLDKLIDVLTLIASVDEAIDIDSFKDVYRAIKAGDINYKHLMYDCYHNAKLICAEEYKKAITPLGEFAYKEKDGVKIYRAEEKEYRCFICCLNGLKRTSAEGENPEYFSDFISASFVATNSLYSFADLNKTLTLGYFDIDPKLMLHAFSRDGYTVGRVHNQLSAISPNRIEFLTPRQMLEKTNENETYSEFCFASKKTSEDNSETHNFDFDNMKPSCVFCLDEPTEWEIEFAKNHELPIFVSNTKNYKYTGERGMHHDDKFTKAY